MAKPPSREREEGESEGERRIAANGKATTTLVGRQGQLRLVSSRFVLVSSRVVSELRLALPCKRCMSTSASMRSDGFGAAM